jgi:hypothetical protein
MRAILFTSSTLLVTLLSGCTCSPATAVPITMRVLNTSRDPIYVDFTQGRLGLEVQRDVLGTLYGFDDLACPCTFCSNVCGGACDCPDAGVELVRRVAPGQAVEREWDGVVQLSGRPACGSEPCTNQENGPLNEAFSLHLCFATQRPLGMDFDDAGVGQGPLPLVGRTCVDRRFAIQDGVVEIGPERGAACTTSQECQGPGELCLSGSCTSGCPANDYPTWGLQIASPADMGFFTASARPPGSQLTGTGTLTGVLHGATLRLTLSRPGAGAGELLTAVLSVQLPPPATVPLVVGSRVAVMVVTGADPDLPNRALVIRDATTGALLLAADTARGGALLGAADLTPFSLGSGAVPVGCRQDGCGKLLFYTRVLDGGTPGSSAEVPPGGLATVVVPQGTYSLLSVTDGAYAAATTCAVADERPWVLWRSLGP